MLCRAGLPGLRVLQESNERQLCPAVRPAGPPPHNLLDLHFHLSRGAGQDSLNTIVTKLRAGREERGEPGPGQEARQTLAQLERVRQLEGELVGVKEGKPREKLDCFRRRNSPGFVQCCSTCRGSQAAAPPPPPPPSRAQAAWRRTSPGTGSCTRTRRSGRPSHMPPFSNR